MAELLSQKEFTVRQMSLAFQYAGDLEKERARLVKENEHLREQVASLGKGYHKSPSAAATASVPPAESGELLHLRSQLQQVLNTVAAREAEIAHLTGQHVANAQQLHDEIILLRSYLNGKEEELQQSKNESEQLHSRLSEVEKEKEKTDARLKDVLQENSREQENSTAYAQQLSEVTCKQNADIESWRKKATEHREYHEGERKDQVVQTVLQYRSIGVCMSPGDMAITCTQRSANVQASSSRARVPKRKAGGEFASKIGLLNLAAHSSPIPPLRLAVLQDLPPVKVDLPEGELEEQPIFHRQNLVDLIGGSIQPLIVTVTNSATPFALAWNIDKYLCMNMNHNPWAPTGPGSHGFMQVGLGREEHTFETPEFRHIFVGADSCYRYCGKYEVLRVERLTHAEWETLPAHVKKEYSETTGIKERHKNHGTDNQIRIKYDSGELLAPCVRLRCVEFDLQFYGELKAAYARLGKPQTGTSISTCAKRPRRNIHPSGDTIDEMPLAKVPRAPSAATASRRQSSRISDRRAQGKVHVYNEDASDDDIMEVLQDL